MSLWTQRYNKYLTNLVFSVLTVSYWSSFLLLGFMVRAFHTWAINLSGKNLVGNLQYGPRTRLVRGIYSSWKNSKICKCFTYWEGDRKKCHRHCKRSIILQNVLCYEREVASLFNTWLVSGCEGKLFRLHFSWTRGTLSERLKVLLQWFCYYKHGII